MKHIFLLILALLTVSGFTQNKGYYWIQFSNKTGTPYSVSSPAQFLSQRAIDRRSLQNIPIVAQDLPVNPTYINSINNIFPVLSSSKWFNGVLVKVTDSTLLGSLSGFSFVSSYKYVRPLLASKSIVTKDQLGTLSDVYNYSWGDTQIKMLNGNILHNLGYKGDGVLIAVIDAGFINANNIHLFDSLYQNNRLISTRDFVTGKNDKTVYEASSHGTSVLSTMAGLINGTMVGTAPHASYSLILSEEAAVEYIYEEYTWACAAEYADSLGANIISSSLGYTTFDDTLMNHTWSNLNGRTSVASLAATYAARKGMVVVVSAGNSGSQSWHKIGIPADADSILTVGAVDSQRDYASFSSVGPSADGRVKPDVASMGSSASIVDMGGVMTTGSGTSFSCPIIAGMAACLWQSHPYAKNMEIIQAIRESADQFLTPDNLTGYGIPDFSYARTLLGIPENINMDEKLISIFPNPFKDYLEFQYFSNNSNLITIELSDMLGRIIYSNSLTLIPNSLNTLRMNNLTDFQKGMYILKTSTSSGNITRLVVKNQ
jgi:serine protease AprX